MATTEDFVMVRLKKSLESGGFKDYVCWIPVKLAMKAKETKGKIRLYFEDKDEWIDGWELPPNFTISDTITKERANELYDRLQRFRRMRVAGRPSYKD